MRQRVYTDTSVLGGCEDEEFAEHSIRLIDSFVRGGRCIVLSNLTVQELAMAPADVRCRLATIPTEHIELLELGPEAMELAEAYIEAAVLPASMRADALTRSTSQSPRSAAWTYW